MRDATVGQSQAEELFTVIFFGKTGAGKSTTINALFGLNWATDSAVACTKEPQIAILRLEQYPNLPFGQIQIVDMPGIGESIEADGLYLRYYKEWIPRAHSLVWVTQANTRAYKRDQIFFGKLSPLFRSSLIITIALNQMDKLGVGEEEEPFNTVIRQPSQDQLNKLPEKIEDVYLSFKRILPNTLSFDITQIVPYTAYYQWGLLNLKSKILSRR